MLCMLCLDQPIFNAFQTCRTMHRAYLWGMISSQNVGMKLLAEAHQAGNQLISMIQCQKSFMFVEARCRCQELSRVQKLSKRKASGENVEKVHQSPLLQYYCPPEKKKRKELAGRCCLNGRFGTSGLQTRQKQTFYIKLKKTNRKTCNKKNVFRVLLTF